MEVNIKDLHPTQLYLSRKEVTRYPDALSVERKAQYQSN